MATLPPQKRRRFRETRERQDKQNGEENQNRCTLSVWQPVAEHKRDQGADAVAEYHLRAERTANIFVRDFRNEHGNDDEHAGSDGTLEESRRVQVKFVLSDDYQTPADLQKQIPSVKTQSNSWKEKKILQLISKCLFLKKKSLLK